MEPCAHDLKSFRQSQEAELLESKFCSTDSKPKQSPQHEENFHQSSLWRVGFYVQLLAVCGPLMVFHGDAGQGKQRHCRNIRKSTDYSTIDNVGTNRKTKVGELAVKNDFPHVPMNLQATTESIASTSSASSQYFAPKLAMTAVSRKLGQLRKGSIPLSLPEIATKDINRGNINRGEPTRNSLGLLFHIVWLSCFGLYLLFCRHFVHFGKLSKPMYAINVRQNLDLVEY